MGFKMALFGLMACENLRNPKYSYPLLLYLKERFSAMIYQKFTLALKRLETALECGHVKAVLAGE